VNSITGFIADVTPIGMSPVTEASDEGDDEVTPPGIWPITDSCGGGGGGEVTPYGILPANVEEAVSTMVSRVVAHTWRTRFIGYLLSLWRLAIK
jgi:hypothetical protein